MHGSLVLLQATAAWLRLSLTEREHWVAECIQSLLYRYPAVQIQFYDAEAWCGFCSDVAQFEFEDLNQYVDLMNDLRSTALYTVPYFEVVHIIPLRRTNFLEKARATKAEPR